MAKPNDDKIKQLLVKVEKGQEALGVKPKAERITNGKFEFHDGTGNFINLNTVREPQVLVNALALMLSRKTATEEAAKLLGVDSKPFEWDGFTIEDWTKDFQNRLAMVKYEARKAQLEATKAQLKALRSEDARTADALEDIEKMF